MHARRGEFTFTAAACVLGGKAAQLRKQQLRLDDWLAGTADKFFALRGAVRCDRFPGEWANFVVEMRLHEDARCQLESRAHIHTSAQPCMHQRIAWLKFEGHTTRHRAALCSTASHCTACNHTASHRTAMHSTAPHHTTQHCTTPPASYHTGRVDGQ